MPEKQARLDPACSTIAILAGEGALPLLLHHNLQAKGCRVKLLAFRGFASRQTCQQADAVADLLDVKGILAQLDHWKPAGVTLVGAVKRPGFQAVLNAYAFIRNRQDIAGLMARGDDHLLRGVVTLLEERGHHPLGIAELAPELLARAQCYTHTIPDNDQRNSIALGLDFLKTISRFDIGQSCLIVEERIIAVEGAEGTDNMLKRAHKILGGGLFRKPIKNAILVKCAKTGQDKRIDLPAIGPRTIHNAAKAGLAGIAIGAGNTLLVDEVASIALANSRKLFLIGCAPEDGIAGQANV